MLGRSMFLGLRRSPAGALVLIGGLAAGLVNTAAAAPLPLARSSAAAPAIVQVRDGCGAGLRYSERRDACVEDFDGGPRGYDDRGPPPPPPIYDRRPPPPEYDRRPPPPAYDRGVEYRAPMPDCGRGMRFSNSRQACVPLEEVVDRRGDADVAAGALVGGAVGALIGSAIQSDQQRGRR